MPKDMLKRILPIALALLVGAGLTTLAFNNNQDSSAPTESEESEHDDHESEEIVFDGDPEETAGVRVATLQAALLEKTIPFDGQIVAHPNGIVRVSSIVPGRIAKLTVAAGDRVQKGQTLAVIESRDVGEAQSSHQQALARFENAKSNLAVIQKQAQAGVFSRAPLEAARRALVDAKAEVRTQGTAVRASQDALENTTRLVRSGSFSDPALEAAKNQVSSAQEVVGSTRAALEQAQSSVKSAESELERRKQQSAAGAYVSRPVEEARRIATASQSARAAAQSEIATTQANLKRMRALATEGLVAQRDLETAQQAFETAQSRLKTARSDETTTSQELERQQKLAATNITASTEVQAAQSELERAQAEVRSQRGQLTRASDALKLAQTQLARQQKVFQEDIANRSEISPAKSTLERAKNAQLQAREKLALATTAHVREQKIASDNLNDIAQLQTARAQYTQAQSDLRAARSTLALFKSSPGKSANIPIIAPISGTVQEREVALGELLSSDTVLMTLVDLDSVAVEVALPESEISQIQMGALVSVEIDAIPERSFRGKIDFIDSHLDPKTRTLTVRALLPNSSKTLRLGLFARGHIQIGSGAIGITVPAEAVLEMDGKKTVFIPTQEPNTFAKRTVTVGATANGQTLIKSGLQSGETVVIEGALMVKAQAMKAELGHSH